MADIIGLDQVATDLRNLSRASSEAARDALVKCGRLAMMEAKHRAPRGPTLKNLSHNLKRKKRTTLKSRPSFKPPGGLEKSIQFESDFTHASVFVPSNALCVNKKTGYNYAKRIHDEQYVTWRNLGPGSKEKANNGAQIGGKFIERAIRDNVGKFREIIERFLNVALRKAWGN
ncbi:MAG: hypothetical protein IKF72_12320 [Kiritimatiellae bacterium]|nr:hypothetical protein [Kiritimatiellia bacterium]